MTFSDQPVTPAGIPSGVPKRFGPYELVRFIGGGGMGSVYEAIHTELRKRVALKIMHAHLAGTKLLAERFQREARSAAQIQHPNVVDVSDVGFENGLPYLVMDYLEGPDLGRWLGERGGYLGRDELLELMLPLVSAVAAAHRAGVVHRDIKPANVLLTKNHVGEWIPKLVDFGISKVLTSDQDLALTQTEALLGTARYMAPEQTYGARHADAQSDVYSLGILLYEASTGVMPFTGESVYELIHAIRHREITPPHRLRPDLDSGLSQVILRALERDKAQRFASAHALGEAIHALSQGDLRARWQREFGGTGSVALLPALSGRPKARKRFWVAALAVALLVVAGVSLKLRPWRAHHATPTAVQLPPAPVVSPPAVAPPSPAPPSSPPANVGSGTTGSEEPALPQRHRSFRAKRKSSPPTPSQQPPADSAPAVTRGRNDAPILE